MSEIVITNANVLDTRTGSLRSGQQIRIQDQHIVEVGASVGKASDARTIDAGGRVVMPGLIDAHIHVMAAVNDHARLAKMSPYLVAALAKNALSDMLRRGFTTARDAGGAEGGLSDAVRLNLFPGPRLFVPGLALANTGAQGDFRARPEEILGCPTCRMTRSISRIVDGPDNVRLAVREEIMSGAHHIKLMASGGNTGRTPIHAAHFTPDEQRAAVEEAVGLGRYVMAHAYGPVAIRRCVDAGVRTIEHGNLIDPETARYIAGKAYVVPTLVTYEAGLEYSEKLNYTPATYEQVKMVLSRGLEALRICRDAGVKLGLGTDLEGVVMHCQLRELAIRSRVETPAQILNSATVVNAELLMHEGKLGELIPGAFADLLIVDGNPLEDLSLFQDDGRNIRVTIKDGHIFKQEV